MAWATLLYSTEEVDDAGRALVRGPDADTPEWLEAIKVIDNWRAAHAFPLNTMQMYLRGKAAAVNRGALVAQRIKRLSSIEKKLRDKSWLTLSQMQDIGGCRAVVDSVHQIRELVKVYEASQIKHKPIGENDYISHPKVSGYRSHHLIYSYFSDKNPAHNGRKIEVQLRSRLQHAWATAVETVGTFTQQALKSSQGERQWLRFFKLMGSVFALKEGMPIVPHTPADRDELLRELRDCSSSLQVDTKLAAYGSALQTIETIGQRGKRFYILALDPQAKTTEITGYTVGELVQALADYSTKEQAIQDTPGGEAVLVSVDSLQALRTAYPNYFLDTSRFREELNSALGGRIGP